MKRRRRNHGAAVPAASLAERLLTQIVPGERLRLVRLSLAWEQALPTRLLRVTAPVAIDGETLVVHVADNQWLHELTYLRADVLARLRGHEVAQGITRLRLRVGPVPQLPRSEPVPEREQAPVLTLQPAAETLDAIAAVEDLSLRSAIATARQSLTRIGRG